MRRQLHTEVQFPGPTPAFTQVPKEIRDRIRDLPATPETLRLAEGQVEALLEAEMHNPSFSAPPPPTVRIVSWNAGQCHFPRRAASVLSGAGADIALLTGMDIGMNRSGQHHTLALVADTMAQSTGIPYGYGAGIEFYELNASGDARNPAGQPVENRSGFHANGWVTRFKARRPALIRLQPEADWFINPLGGQRRVGSRLAVAAIFELGGFELVAASVRLERTSDAAGRRRQMRLLLEGLDDYAARRPVVLGGDFSTGAEHPDCDYHDEGLFREAERCGYEWENANTRGGTVRGNSVRDGNGPEKARFDWFFVKGVRPLHPAVVPAEDETGEPLSGHDAIAFTLPIPVDLR
jgi:Metal-dependent hydrolase